MMTDTPMINRVNVFEYLNMDLIVVRVDIINTKDMMIVYNVMNIHCWHFVIENMEFWNEKWILNINIARSAHANNWYVMILIWSDMIGIYHGICG